jgi:hypothetical protein
MRTERKVVYLVEFRSKNGGLYVSGSRAEEMPTLHYDELSEPRASQWESLPIIIGFGLGESSAPQNLRTDQRGKDTSSSSQ